MKTTNTLKYLVNIAIVFALMVVMLGAYTRLTHAGLGCPDWPGCYGHMVLPSETTILTKAQAQFPTIPIEARKAWTEMIHRYAAGSLAMLIFAILITACVNRQKSIKYNRRPATCSQDPETSVILATEHANQDRTGSREQVAGRRKLDSQRSLLLPGFLALLVIFQAALGMWTVTLKLLPVVVMGHLLGGILIFSCLCVYRCQLNMRNTPSVCQSAPHLNNFRWYLGLGVVIIFFQIALGGWVSANYAGIACTGFPTCNGQWLPALHFEQGFHLLSPVGANYQGGLLSSEVRVTIQFVHRFWAVVTAMYVLILSLMIMVKVRHRCTRLAVLGVLCILLTQFSLGIFNVIFLLPIAVAVAHNGVAALLLATFMMLFYISLRKDDA